MTANDKAVVKQPDIMETNTNNKPQKRNHKPTRHHDPSQKFNIPNHYGKKTTERIREYIDLPFDDLNDEEGKFFLIVMAFKAFIDVENAVDRNYPNFDLCLTPMGLLKGLEVYERKTQRRQAYYKSRYPDTNVTNTEKILEKAERENGVFKKLQATIVAFFERPKFLQQNHKYVFLKQLQNKYPMFWDAEHQVAILPEPIYARTKSLRDYLPSGLGHPKLTADINPPVTHFSAPPTVQTNITTPVPLPSPNNPPVSNDSIPPANPVTSSTSSTSSIASTSSAPITSINPLFSPPNIYSGFSPVRPIQDIARPVHNLPPLLPEDETFSPRPELYQTLSASVASHRLQFVTGCFGSGKSTLVRYYAYQHFADYQYICWIDATSPDTIRQSIAKFANEVNYSGAALFPDCTLSVLRVFLEQHPSWLLILDHAWMGNRKDVKMIEECLPENSLWYTARPNQKVIITTIYDSSTYGGGNLYVPPYTNMANLLLSEEKQNDYLLRFQQLRQQLLTDSKADPDKKFTNAFLDFFVFGLENDLSEMVHIFFNIYPYLVSPIVSVANHSDARIPFHIKVTLSQYSLCYEQDGVLVIEPAVKALLPFQPDNNIIDWEYFTMPRAFCLDTIMQDSREFLCLNDQAHRIFHACTEVRYFLNENLYYLAAKRMAEAFVIFGLRIFPYIIKQQVEDTQVQYNFYTYFFSYLIKRCANLKVFSMQETAFNPEDAYHWHIDQYCKWIQPQFANIGEDLDLILWAVISTITLEISKEVYECYYNFYADFLPLINLWLEILEQKAANGTLTNLHRNHASRIRDEINKFFEVKDQVWHHGHHFFINEYDEELDQAADRLDTLCGEQKRSKWSD